ncbi:MAG: hypothetical protein ACFFD2_09125 [Promethearchaeota archaeon]
MGGVIVINWIINLMIGIMVLVGGILCMTSRTSGGFLTLVAGILVVFMTLVGSLLQSTTIIV